MICTNLVQGKEGDTGDLHDLEADPRDITDGVALATETGNEHLQKQANRGIWPVGYKSYKSWLDLLSSVAVVTRRFAPEREQQGTL